MKTSVILIGFACIVFVLMIYWSIKSKDKDVIIGIFMSVPLLAGVVAALINGASVNVTVVNGLQEEECTSARYFLIYSANMAANGKNTVFLTPYGKDVVFNNTTSTLTCHPIEYGDVKKSYKPVDIPPHTIIKVQEKPTYIFEPAYDVASTKSSSGTYRWILLKKGDKIEFKKGFTYRRALGFED